jgi:hypothetical protein
VKRFLKRLRGAIGNALVWAITWTGAAAAFLLLAILLSDMPPGVNPFRGFWRVAGMFGGMGFLCGGAFSLYLGLIGRSKRLDELGAIRYGVRGGVASGLVLPFFALLVRGPGDFPFWAMTFYQSSIAMVLGGISAFATVKLAQRGDRILAEASLRELETEQDQVLSLLSGEEEP